MLNELTRDVSVSDELYEKAWLALRGACRRAPHR
jgi:hypothetical protein